MKQIIVKKYFLSAFIFLLVNASLKAQKMDTESTIFRTSKETITPVELSHGESIVYERKDGEKICLQLIFTSANILYTNRNKIPSDESGNDRGNMYRARLLYEYSCKIAVNGIQMNMQRYVGSQESFFEPYVINGVRIWFIGVSDIFEENGGFLNTVRSANGQLHKDARFVFQDMEERICPKDIYPWFVDDQPKNVNFIYKENFIDIGRCFNGADCFMGAYLAGESHGALDINMKQNSIMYAPFKLDTQKGIRAEGVKKWPDGSEWRINTGHIIQKLVPDNAPVKGGEAYGIGARRACWWHPHAHFGFQIFEQDVLYEIDPWIIFWQLFEDNKMNDNILKAMMNPLNNSATGEEIIFKSVNPFYELQNDSEISHYWTLGDGSWKFGHTIEHAYSHPGIYPVTLTIKKGDEIASFTQHITIKGEKISKPVLTLSAPDEPSFRLRPIEALDVYGKPGQVIPHSLKFLARPSRPVPDSREIKIINKGEGTLSKITWDIDYLTNNNKWIFIRSEGSGNHQKIEISVNGKNLNPGQYEAIISLSADNSFHSSQKFRVLMTIPSYPASSKGVIIDDADKEFYCTPYFWIGHRFHGWGWPELKNAEGYNHFYLINGKRNKPGEFARFTPDLEAGEYDVWLYERTPYASGPPANNEPARFKVRVVHADGDTTFWMEPKRIKGFYPRPYEGQRSWAWLEPQPSRKIGTFRFKEGNDGFVEILSEGSSGQVIVDAVRFLKRYGNEIVH